MNAINITKIDKNMEILSKIVNSIAKKYNCSVKYDPEKNEASFLGDEYCKAAIADDLAEMFNINDV